MAQDITYVGVGDLTFKEAEDGSLFVYGLATDPTLDMDQQICDPGWLKSAMPQWFKTGANVREQHSNIAAGVGIELNADGDKWMLKSEVIDPVTAQKVRKGVLKGYSIGIKQAQVMKSDEAPNGVIVGGNIVEVSLVDRPANPSAKIEIAKSVNGELVMSEIVKSDDLLDEAVMTEAPFKAPELDTETHVLPCPDCDGEGKVHLNNNEWNTCEMCNGTGRRPEDSPLDIIQEDPSHPGANLRENNPITGPKAVEGEVEKREFSDKEREEAADAGQALPDGSYPIKTVADLKNAIQAYGRAKDPAKVKAHIKARAKALGKEDLIPENWKSVEGDVEKAGESVKHDPADLIAVRAGLIALIKAELDEMLAGEENEVCDVSELLCTLSMFLDWWTNEASENETEAPFTGWDNDEKDSDDMAYIGLGVSADLIKSATAPEATDEIRAELRAEIVKALGLDEAITKTALAEAKEELELLKADLAAVKEMAVPGGPALRMTQNQLAKSSQVDQLRAEADRYRKTASQVIDLSLRNAYIEKAMKLEADADVIAKN